MQGVEKSCDFRPISRYSSKTVEDRWVHAARRLTSIEFSFDPCNIYRDGPRGVGYPADAGSVGDSHPSCLLCCGQTDKQTDSKILSTPTGMDRIFESVCLFVRSITGKKQMSDPCKIFNLVIENDLEIS